MSRTAIITGASRGIGAATAKLLATEGYAVIINYRKSAENAEALCGTIIESGGKAHVVQADVSSADDVERLFKEANETFGMVTHLVNNAGVLFTQSAFENISLERMKAVFETNFNSAFMCTQAFLKQLECEGAIVNVSSVASRTGSPFEYVDYAASKGALDSMTLGLAKELAGRNIRVNGVRPGFIKTDMHADGGEPNRVERLAPNLPMKRGGEPKEVAEAIAWLLSDKASYVTGNFIDLAGGI